MTWTDTPLTAERYEALARFLAETPTETPRAGASLLELLGAYSERIRTANAALLTATYEARVWPAVPEIALSSLERARDEQRVARALFQAIGIDDDGLALRLYESAERAVDVGRLLEKGL